MSEYQYLTKAMIEDWLEGVEPNEIIVLQNGEPIGVMRPLMPDMTSPESAMAVAHMLQSNHITPFTRKRGKRGRR